MAISRYNFPTRIHSGPGAISMAAELLKEAGATKVLLVTDEVLAGLPPVAQVKEAMPKHLAALEVFSGIKGNPTVSQTMAGAEHARNMACDAIVAVGGGAALDVAKCIAIMRHHGGELLDYEDGKEDGRVVDGQMPYVLAVPTTAGTGSEVGRSSVISDDSAGSDLKTKRIIFSPRMMPHAVILDADLTLGLPAKVTAATGVDALTHCVEAFLAKGSHPMADGIALEGMRLIAENLTTVYDLAQKGDLQNDAHRKGRDAMLNASMMGAVAFQKGLGVVHSCAHALGAVCDLHHGTACAIMLPPSMDFNLQTSADRMARMAHALGVEDESAQGFIDFCRAFNERLGIPAGLAAAGVKPEHLDDLVAFALKDGCHHQNPRPVSAEDFRKIFESAM